MSRLVAICGRRRSGKDTIADILCQKYGYEKIHIADPLKHVVGYLFGFSKDQMECDQKDKVDPRWGISPRQAMQFVGTDVMQEKIQELLPEIGRKFWIRSLLESCVLTDKKYVISDLRFLHEEEELKKHGFVIWKVVRPSYADHNPAVDLHRSEREWEEIKEDVFIRNEGSMEDLQKSVSSSMPASLQRL